MAELADAQASGACDRKAVWVQVPSPAFFLFFNIDKIVEAALGGPLPGELIGGENSF